MGLKKNFELFFEKIFLPISKDFYESNHVALVLTKILLFLWPKMAKKIKKGIL